MLEQKCCKIFSRHSGWWLPAAGVWAGGRRDLRDRAGEAGSAWRLVAVSLGPAPEPGTSHTTDTEMPALAPAAGASHNIAICVMFCKTERAV